MMSLNDYFDKIYCINLSSRPDRKKKMIDRFSSLGIENVQFFTTVEYGFSLELLKLLKTNNHDFVFPGEIGCAIAHYSIIKIARDEGLKNVLIFEDDCTFHKDFNTLLPEYLDILPENWDLFYLYLMGFKDHSFLDFIVDSKLYRPYNMHCASAYAVNQKMFQPIIDSIDDDFRIIDSRYRLMQNLDYNIYSVYPNLCSQELDISNIRGDGKTTPKIDYFSNVITFDNNKREDYE